MKNKIFKKIKHNKKGIYSKDNLQSFVYDLIYYLYYTKDYNNERLSNDVIIYSMNKCFYVDEDNYNQIINNIPIHIEKNVKVKDYLEYYNKDTLTLSMDSTLNEYLYYYDIEGCEEVSNKVSDIFEKHGFYYDFGASYILKAEEKPQL